MKAFQFDFALVTNISAFYIQAARLNSIIANFVIKGSGHSSLDTNPSSESRCYGTVAESESWLKGRRLPRDIRDAMGARYDVLDGTRSRSAINAKRAISYTEKTWTVWEMATIARKKAWRPKSKTGCLTCRLVIYFTSSYLFCVVSTWEKIQSWVANGDLEFVVSNAEKKNQGAFDARRLDVNAMAMIQTVQRCRLPHWNEGIVWFLRRIQAWLVAPSWVLPQE